MPGNTKKHRRGNGEGSVYQRKDGTWAAVLTVGVKPDGKPDRKFLYGKTRKEVADKLREAQNKLDAGVIPGGDNVLFSTWVMNWLEVVIKPGIKEQRFRPSNNWDARSFRSSSFVCPYISASVPNIVPVRITQSSIPVPYPHGFGYCRLTSSRVGK